MFIILKKGNNVNNSLCKFNEQMIVINNEKKLNKKRYNQKIIEIRCRKMGIVKQLN